MSLIRSGQPTLAAQKERKQLEESVDSHLALTPVSQENLERIEKGSYPAFGNPSAPLHIVEFVDYECPYSRQVAPTLRDFMKVHAQDAYFVIRDFPLTEIHPDADHSALAAHCVFALGGREVYWNYYDRLFATQGSHGEDQLRAFALQAGLVAAKYDSCIADQVNTQNIHESLQTGVTVDVVGTPTFFINGYKIEGALDTTAFEIALEKVKQRVLKQ